MDVETVVKHVFHHFLLSPLHMLRPFSFSNQGPRSEDEKGKSKKVLCKTALHSVIHTLRNTSINGKRDHY